MTHSHVAGAIHADAQSLRPSWLSVPDDVNVLVAPLWSSSVHRRPDGEVEVGGIRVSELAAEVGTPAYVLDEDDLRQRARAFRDAFAGWSVYYAGKSFLCRAVVEWLVADGLNIDVCTGGELEIALAGGADPTRLALHGNNKSVAELRRALEVGVGRIVVDSFDEIDRLEQLAAELSVRPQVMLRVTTGIEAHTHNYIATAHEDQKFGFSLAVNSTGRSPAERALDRCEESAALDLIGIHSHIGSQIFEVAGFEQAARRTLRALADFRDRHGRELAELDLGGGFGIAYTTQDSPADPADLAAGIRRIVELESAALGLAVPAMSVEPGRAISGPSTLLLYQVGTVKPVELDGGKLRYYVSVDGGMSDNIRPALYAAAYSCTLASRTSDAEPVLARVVGKHCEGGDIVVHDEFVPADIAPGDLLAVPGAGAYSRSMASNYNHVPRPPVVAVKHGQWRTLVRRETVADLLALEVDEPYRRQTDAQPKNN